MLLLGESVGAGVTVQAPTRKGRGRGPPSPVASPMELEAPGLTGVFPERRQTEVDKGGRDAHSPSTRQSKMGTASRYLLEMEARRGKRFSRACG